MAGGARTWLTAASLAFATAFAPSPRDAKADPGATPRASIVPVSAVVPRIAEEASRDLADAPAPAEYEAWKGLSAGCSYMTPKGSFVASDGGVDVVFHFHAGQMSGRDMAESGTNAVFVSCGFGLGTAPYADRFASPRAFTSMSERLLRDLEKDTHRRGLHFRHVALASWSAGFAAVGKILGVRRNYDLVDAVVLLDSLHARYKGRGKHAPALGVAAVDVETMGVWVKLARDAAAGKKALVVTHSSIVPPDYASTGEAVAAVLGAAGVAVAQVAEGDAADDLGVRSSAARGRPMAVAVRADAGALHVRGYRGRGPKDHFDHLHLVGEAIRMWVAPRWKRENRVVYTLVGEQR